MAKYDDSKEERKELLNVRKNNRGDFLIISEIKVKDSDDVKVDIRNYYTDDNDEVKPTSKGVRFSSEILKDIMLALFACHAIELLDDWQTALSSGLVGQDENLIVFTLCYSFSECTIQLV